MSVTIQHRRGTAAQWTLANPILAPGEIGIETDTNAYKIGDGATAWSALSYAQLSGEFLSVLFDAYAPSSEPSAPAADRMIVYAKSIGSRIMPKFKGPSGLDSPLQPGIWSNGMLIVTPASSTAYSTIGGPAPTSVGTVSTPALAAGSLRASTRRAILTSAATAGSASEMRIAQTVAMRGDAPGQGGFFATFRFGCSSAVAGQRVAVGMFGVTTAIAVTQDPAALTNCIFVGNAAADANLSLMHNDASGTCTKVGLGALFPVPSSTNNAIYELVLFAAPNASTVGWRVIRLDTGDVASGTIVSADIPASTTFLAPHMYVNNNGVAASVILDFYRLYIETDY